MVDGLAFGVCFHVDDGLQHLFLGIFLGLSKNCHFDFGA